MCVIGVDAHRQLIAAVAVDDAGRELGDWTGPNSREAWAELLVWAETIANDAERRWGIEGSGNQGRGLAQQLVNQGEVVFEINPRWTAERRGRSRRIDKSDHADARAITRLLREEGNRLPRVNPDDATTPLAILTRERDDLVADITRNRNRLHAELLRVDPVYTRVLPSLQKRAGLEAVLAWDDRLLGIAERTQLTSAQRRVTRMLALLDQLDAVSAELETLAEPVAGPLTTMFGVAALTAGMLAGYLGPGRRFATDAELAKYAGVAPLETASAGVLRHRLNRTGHRQLNAVIHRIALTQARGYEPARRYVRRRMAEGKSWREAIRALKRYVIRAIFRCWNQCLDALGYPKQPPHSKKEHES
jgi:transposase